MLATLQHRIVSSCRTFALCRHVVSSKRSVSTGAVSLTTEKKRSLDIEKIPDIKEFLSSTAQIEIAATEDEEGTELPPYMMDRQHGKFPYGKTVYIETYGCQMNVNDSEYAWSILKKDGYTKVTDPEKADVILLVTCSIREKAEDKIWQRLHKLKLLKDKHQSKLYPKLGILGCMAERLKKQIVEKQKAVDIIAGPDAYRDLPRLLDETTSHSTTAINVMLSVDETYADIMPLRFDDKSKTAFVSIMRGCDNMCSYCIVPFTRGRERSRPIQSIVEEVKMLSRQGIRQVTLLGQNVNSYRDTSVEDFSSTSSNLSSGFRTIYKDKTGGMRFADLLDRVSEVDPEMRIRFTSPHPKDFPDEVLQIMSERANICEQIHLPAQSGSSRMLDLMRRGHTIDDYMELVGRIRSFMPNMSFSTDIIAGFCGEKLDDHLQTVQLMKDMKYNYAFMFKYSMRKVKNIKKIIKIDLNLLQWKT